MESAISRSLMQRDTCARTDAWRSTSESAFSSTCCASRRRSPSSCAIAAPLVSGNGHEAMPPLPGQITLHRNRMSTSEPPGTRPCRHVSFAVALSVEQAALRRCSTSRTLLILCCTYKRKSSAAQFNRHHNVQINVSATPTERSKERRSASAFRSAVSRASSSACRCRRLSASRRFSSAAMSAVTLYARACVPGAESAAGGAADDDGGGGG